LPIRLRGSYKALLLGLPVALVLLNIVLLASLYAHEQKVIGPSAGRGELCVGQAYLVRFPKGLGPWNALLVARNTSSGEYYVPVLVPWPLRELGAWGSAPSAWAENGLALSSPTLYTGLSPVSPIRRTVYAWRPTGLWLAILPCTQVGYNASVLGRVEILARSKPLKGLVFEAVASRDLLLPNMVPLPLSTGWLHVIAFTGPGSRAGSIMLPGGERLVKELAARIRGSVALELLNTSNDYGFFWVSAAHSSMLYTPWGPRLGTGFQPYSTAIRYSESGTSIGGAYVYTLPGTPLRLSIRVVNMSSPSQGRSVVSSYTVALSNITGHVDVVGVASPRPGPGIIGKDLETSLALETRAGRGLPASFLSSFVNAFLYKPENHGCSGFVPRNEVVLANPVPIKPPGVTVPVYLFAGEDSSLSPMDELVVETRAGNGSVIEVLVNGLVLCEGVGGCNASLSYPWLYPLVLESVVSGEPLEVTILSDKPTTLQMLRIIYGLRGCRGSGEELGHMTVMEPVNPRTLTPLGLVIVSENAKKRELIVVVEAPGLLELKPRGARIVKASYEILDPRPRRALGLVLAEKLLQIQLGNIDDWEPFLAALKRSLEAPFAASKGDTLYLAVHNSYAAARITYEAMGETPMILARYRAPGISTPSPIAIPLRG